MNYILLSLSGMALYAIFMRKNLTKIEIYSSCFFALFYGKTVDEILDLKKNLYGYVGKGVQYFGILSQLIIFPTVNLLFLKYFPFKKRNLTKLYYILGWTLFSIIFERVSLKTRFFYYNKWKSWYSLVLYPFIFLSLVANFKLIRYLINTKNKRSEEE